MIYRSDAEIQKDFLCHCSSHFMHRNSYY